jgi:outer membrane protein assembly factor BamD
MEQAYAEYKAGKHDDAVSTIDRFIRTYPTHKQHRRISTTCAA